jgi:hypothetical protein
MKAKICPRKFNQITLLEITTKWKFRRSVSENKCRKEKTPSNYGVIWAYLYQIHFEHFWPDSEKVAELHSCDEISQLVYRNKCDWVYFQPKPEKSRVSVLQIFSFHKSNEKIMRRQNNNVIIQLHIYWQTKYGDCNIELNSLSLCMSLPNSCTRHM